MSLNTAFSSELDSRIDQLKADRVYKQLNYLDSPQSARVQMEGRGEILILSSNNYLGLCDEPSVIDAGIRGLRRFGAGTASVRFICGTFTIHRDLEEAIARFVGTESSLTFVAAWNANEALTSTILQEGDFVVSDALNHASIIDSIRLAKAIVKCTSAVYKHGDLDDLVSKLEQATGAKRRLIWTDGVFSMEGAIAKLPDLIDIARRYDAVLAVDDSHSTGVLGETGRGTAEHFGMLGEVDIITSTLGKALGGAAGGSSRDRRVCATCSRNARGRSSSRMPSHRRLLRAPSRRSSSWRNTQGAWRSSGKTRGISGTPSPRPVSNRWPVRRRSYPSSLGKRRSRSR